MAALGGGPLRAVGDDAGIVAFDDDALATVAARCREHPALFVRHLSRVQAIAPLEQLSDLLNEAAAITAQDVALQVWTAEGADGEGRSGVEAALRTTLEAAGRRVSRAGAALTLHACLTRDGVVLGSAGGDAALSDWPGGRVRLRASGISRAAMKLEEAALVFGLDLRGPGTAVDLGASPGGWSQVLAQRGYQVIAVDPARLDPAVAKDPRIDHRKMTAEAFFDAGPPAIDLLVNDMRMDAVESAELTLRGRASLRPGGLAVVTMKLPEGRPAQAAERAIGRLRKGFDLVAARQLFHNRSEVTVVLQRP